MNSASPATVYISADIDERADDISNPFGALRGHVDIFELGSVEGWAVDLSNVNEPLTLEILVGNDVVARCETGLPREDIALRLGPTIRPKFRFPNDFMAALKTRMRLNGDVAKLSVRIANSTLHLRSKKPLPTLAEFLAGDGATERTGFNLLARMSVLRDAARELASRPLRPQPTQMQGIVEAAAIDETGGVWLVGWMKRSPVIDYAAVVVDLQKMPAALSVTWFARSDLSPEFDGFVGLLQSEWRPGPASSPIIYLDSLGSEDNLEGTAHLTAVKPLRIISKPDYIKHFESLSPRYHTGHTAALEQALRQSDAWGPVISEPDAPAKACVEQLLVLPGFGCIASGWALSPMHNVENFALRLGSSILQCDPDTLSFKSRPDLIGVFPGCDRLTDRAGFLAVFRGDITDSSATGPRAPEIKLLFLDGTSSNHPIELRAMRRIGRAVAPDDVFTLYPSLTAESFFPAFAEALRRDARTALAAARPHRIVRTGHVVVFVAPDDRSDLFLLFEEIRQHMPASGPDCGVVIMAGNTGHRADVISLFAASVKIAAFPASLFFTDSTAYAFQALPEVLAMVEARSFTFVAASVVLTSIGWQNATRPHDDSNNLRFLEIVDPASGGFEHLSAECFAWNTASFTAWQARATVFLGGIYADNMLGKAAPGPPNVMHGSAFQTRMPFASRVAIAVNKLALGED